MNYIVFGIGLIVCCFGFVDLNILFIGLAIIGVSIFMISKKSKSQIDKVGELEQTPLIDRLNNITIAPLNDNALSNAMSDTIAVTKKIITGGTGEVTKKALINGTLGILNDIDKVVK
jgi:hypothetical protein